MHVSFENSATLTDTNTPNIYSWIDGRIFRLIVKPIAYNMERYHNAPLRNSNQSGQNILLFKNNAWLFTNILISTVGQYI